MIIDNIKLEHQNKCKLKQTLSDLDIGRNCELANGRADDTPKNDGRTLSAGEVAEILSEKMMSI